MADATQILTLLGDGYVRKNDKGELVLLAFQVDKDGQDVPVGSEADPLYMLLADGQEVTITDSTFNNDINKVGNVSVKHVGANQVLASDYAVATSAVPYYLDGAGNAKAVVMDDLGDINGIDITDRLAQTNHSVMYGLYNNTNDILPIGTDVQGSNSGIGNYAALFTNDAVVGWGDSEVASAFPVGDSMAFEYGNVPGVGAFGYFYVDKYGDFEVLEGDRTGEDYHALNELAVRNNFMAIGSEEVANQSNAPGSMPSATLSGFGQPIDYENVGDGFGGDAGLVVNAAIGDGFGAPIGSNVPGQPMDNVASLNVLAATYSGYGAPIDSETVGDGIGPDTGLVVNAATYDGYGTAIDSYNFGNFSLSNGYVALLNISAMGGVYQADGGNTEAIGIAVPGDWAVAFGTPNDSAGVKTVASLDAVGGVAVSPAFGPNDGLVQDGSERFGGSASINMGLSQQDSYYYVINSTYDGDGGSYANDIALDTAMTFWGRQGVSDAQELGVIYLDPTNFKGPVGASQMLAYGYGDSRLLQIDATYDGDGGSYLNDVALNTATTFWGRGGVSDAQPLTNGYNTGVVGPTIGSVTNGVSPADNFFYNITGTYYGDGGSFNDSFGLDTTMTFWGKQGVADAISVDDLYDGNFDGSSFVPVVGGQVLGYFNGDGSSRAVDSKLSDGADITSASNAMTLLVKNLNYVWDGVNKWVPMIQPAII